MQGSVSARGWTIELLLERRTPPRFLLWLHHSVRILVGICKSEFPITSPIKVSCRFAIWFWTMEMLKNLPLTSKLVILSSFNYDILFSKCLLYSCVGRLLTLRVDIRGVLILHYPKGADCMGLLGKSDTWIWYSLKHQAINSTTHPWSHIWRKSCCPHHGHRGDCRICSFQGTESALWMLHLLPWILWWRCLVRCHIVCPPSNVFFHFTFLL